MRSLCTLSERAGAQRSSREKDMAGRLQGKVAIVTGAGCVGPGWGNGRATAVIFAREGARIFAVDRDAETMRETVACVRDGGGEITTHVCDVTGSAAGGPVELTLEGWESQIDSNLTSVFLACKYVLPVMVRQNGGAIVNTSSASGIRFTGAAQVGYAA